MVKREREKKYSIPGIYWEVIRVRPVSFVLQYALSIVSSVLLGLFTVQLQNVFNHAASMVKAPSAGSLRVLLLSLLILFLYKYGSEGLEILNGYLGNMYYNRCAAHFIHLFNEKMGKVSAISFENEDNLNLYQKAFAGATAGRGMLHIIMDVFALYLPYFLTIGIYLKKQDPLLLIILVFLAAPVLITNQMKKKIHTQLNDQAVKWQRRKDEYAKYCSDPAYFKEVRVNDLFSFFYAKYHEAREAYNKVYIWAERKRLRLDLITKVITLAGFLAVILLLVQRLAAGVVSIGAFGAVFYSLDELYSLMEEVLVSRLSEYHKDLPALKAFVNMMNCRSIEQEPSDANESFSELSLTNVSFSYPKAQDEALKNISFTIHKNDKIAVVGYNGSGKSTLAKLLMGLYEPADGSITMDGRTIRKMDPRHVSVLFQSFNRYKETVLNNVKIGEIERHWDTAQERKQVGDILKKVCLDISEQDETQPVLDMLCAREFGGTDLSGGQWQRLATARMLYRDRDFVILDEPTSAIDPVSEYQLFHLFEEELQNKTAIIITHRMASVRFCNRIMVLRDGEIEAMGDHDTLMRTSPLYYKLYHSVEECYE